MTIQAEKAKWAAAFTVHLHIKGYYPTRAIRADGRVVLCRMRGRVNGDLLGLARLSSDGWGKYWRRSEQPRYWKATAPAPEKLRAAIEYVNRGWPVLPLHSFKAGRCSCGEADCPNCGKHPRTPHRLKDASISGIDVLEWWLEWPDANIGIVTGAASGLVVVNIDGEDGARSLAVLEAKYGRVQSSISVRMGHSRQVWFRLPHGHSHPSGSVGNGFDIMADGAYVVAPPSIHPSGRKYEFEPGGAPSEISLAPAPLWIWQALVAHGRSP